MPAVERLKCLETIARTAGEDIARVLRGEAPKFPVNAVSS